MMGLKLDDFTETHTEKGVGLGIESGYAFAKGIPIVTVAKKGSDISETLVGISKDIFIYDNPESLDTLFCNFKLNLK